MERGPWIRAWRPPVPGVAEVLHAHFPHHAYPSHTHDTWTLLLVDTGTVVYDLGGHEHATRRASVTLLPPHVPHDGRGATEEGFRKRVIYLEADVLDPRRSGRAVDDPTSGDPALLRRVRALHDALGRPGDELEAASDLALVVERLDAHLRGAPVAEAGRDAVRDPVSDAGLAARLRELLDSHLVDGISLAEAAAELEASPVRLVRTFRRELGISPHRYLTGRRVDAARRLLLDGVPAARVAAEVGFHDQSHLTRHFKRVLGVPPGRYAARSA
ncbi:AraC family transcriptional regulator [Nocardioides sp. cx-169]|uniref:AraC family transcriptional regulator n=1 Tax=Nocardioides sp. cx-169 TaxID=2899080 RepID=UPI001E341CBA|nr:AraC family transcriptional regulator [Nocardioides sp. cx-169]MCD4532800.1 AraC family transcriptional regulator [Nocardioides sp. cx-169]